MEKTIIPFEKGDGPWACTNLFLPECGYVVQVCTISNILSMALYGQVLNSDRFVFKMDSGLMYDDKMIVWWRYSVPPPSFLTK